MRIAGLAIVVILGVVLAIRSSGAGKLAKPPARLGERPGKPKPVVSKDGLLGLREVGVQTHVAGDDQWRKIAGITQDSVKADVESRLRKVAGLKLSQTQSPAMPRLLVQIIGHVISGFPEADPPSATYITVGVLQPVSLLRPGPGGEQVIANGVTTSTTLLLTGKASTMRSRVSEKLAHLLDEFEKDYQRANPRPA
jgi:hypothetical protein